MALTLLPVLLALPQGRPDVRPAPDKLPLAVQYVGRHQTERGKAFVSFLNEQFATVFATAPKDVATAAAAQRAFADADVLLVDSNLAGRLPAGYAKPMVVVSGQGQRTAESLGARLDWL